MTLIDKYIKMSIRPITQTNPASQEDIDIAPHFQKLYDYLK